MRLQETLKSAGSVANHIINVQGNKNLPFEIRCGAGVSITCADQSESCNAEATKAKIICEENTTIQTGNYAEWNVDFLVDHIQKTYHSDIEEKALCIKKYASLVVQVYAHDYPELIQIQRLFSELSQELKSDIKKEELVLFPLIRKMSKFLKEENPIEKPELKQIHYLIEQLRSNHNEAGAIFKQLQVLANIYNPPADACTAFRLLYSKMEEFEEHLSRYLHLENDFLFPKALGLKNKLSANSLQFL